MCRLRTRAIAQDEIHQRVGLRYVSKESELMQTSGNAPNARGRTALILKYLLPVFANLVGRAFCRPHL
jgi:hypothetical protein